MTQGSKAFLFFFFFCWTHKGPCGFGCLIKEHRKPGGDCKVNSRALIKVFLQQEEWKGRRKSRKDGG